MGPEGPDILLPPAPTAGDPWAGWLLTALVIGLVGLVLGYLHRRARQPLRRLRRALRRERLGPREAAHALAVVLREGAARHGRDPGAALLGELDALRFGREPPSASRLLELIGRAEQQSANRTGDV